MKVQENEIAPAGPAGGIDLTFVDKAVEEIGRRPEAVIPLLQAIQSHYRYLPREALERVCEITEITPASIVGVSTFYTQFRHQPVGKHVIQICHGTACHVKHSPLIDEAFKNHLGIKEGKTPIPRGSSRSRRWLAWAAARWLPSWRSAA